MNEILNFLQKLVQIPSQNGIDPERKIANFVYRKLKVFKFSPKILGPPDHPSVICFLKKANAKKTIWLESHLDTVPAGNLKKWKFQPFKGEIKGNKIYGRGAADSKIGIAIFSYLARSLFYDPQFKGNIFLSFSSDEESGNFTGIKKILKIAPKANVCILGYQGKEISIGARGFLRLKLTVFGKSAHTGSRYKKGINAIHKMQKAIEKLQKVKFLKGKEKFFEYGANLNFSLIEGGEAINIVPNKCEAAIDIRFLPSQSKGRILNEICKKLNEIKQKDKDFKFKIEILNYQEPFLTNPSHPFIKILKENAQRILKRKIKLTTSGAGNVGNLISKKKIPVIGGFGCEFGNAHSENEWLKISDIPKVFEIYRKSLIEFCKNDPN
jgi:acetylornithine deacetylase/succinyl-diaminopimelate desuccinylase family protein